MKKVFAGLSVAVGLAVGLPQQAHAVNWQKLADAAASHSYGNEQGTQPGRAATSADAPFFAQTQGIKFAKGSFYPADPATDPDAQALEKVPRIVDVSFGPSQPHVTVLIAYSNYYGPVGTHIALTDAQHKVLWESEAPEIRILPTENAGVHDFASALSYPGWVINRWQPASHTWSKFTSVGTPF